MSIPNTKDPDTGVQVSRLTLGEGNYLLPYYTAEALSPDGSLIACTRERDGCVHAVLIETADGSERVISDDKAQLLDESIAFHREKNWVFYGGQDGLWWYNADTEKTELIYDCTGTTFQAKSEISVGDEYVVFFIFERTPIGKDREGNPPKVPPVGNLRSFIVSVHIESGAASVVWGEHTYLSHPVISPLSDDVILYGDQGAKERLQELFIIWRTERDGREPFKLYKPYKQRPTYVGHSFFTQDGWVGTQGMQFGGQRPDGQYADMYGFNGIIRIDGTCDRRARCPGGNKPLHCHAAFADSWWVGDTLPGEGSYDTQMLCIMKNNWETGFVQAEPFCAHGCTHERPFHVHPRFTRDEKRVLFNSNYRGNCNIYIAETEEFFSRWQDRVPFEPRPARNCRPSVEFMRSREKGPEA
jgi:hypothetical protein